MLHYIKLRKITKKMNNLDLLFNITDYEWTLYSIHRLNCIQYLPQYIQNEFIKQIFLEYEFRRTVDELIDTF